MSRSNNPSPFLKQKWTKECTMKQNMKFKMLEVEMRIFDYFPICSFLIYQLGLFGVLFIVLETSFNNSCSYFKSHKQNIRMTYKETFLIISRKFSTFLTPRHYSKSCLITFKSHLFQGGSKSIMAYGYQIMSFPTHVHPCN